MTSKFTGVIPALLTPFDSKQQIDEASLRRLVRWNLKQGVDGLYVGGSTAEAFVQSVEERQFVLKVVADEVKGHATEGKTTLIAHVGCISTAECQTLAKSAQNLEYDAVSAVTPFYYPFSFEEHCNHYRAIIEAAPKLPMIVYNFPAMSGVKLSLAQISELIQLPNVIALKQTSDNLYQMEQIRRAHPEKIIYNGYDEIFLSGQMAGANGGIGSTYNVMSWRYSNIIKLIIAGKFEEARQQQTECNKVIDLLIEAGVFRGLKTILHYMGVIDNPICRQPFGPVKEQHLPALRAMASELEAEFKRQQ